MSQTSDGMPVSSILFKHSSGDSFFKLFRKLSLVCDYVFIDSNERNVRNSLVLLVKQFKYLSLTLRTIRKAFFLVEFGTHLGQQGFPDSAEVCLVLFLSVALSDF